MPASLNLAVPLSSEAFDARLRDILRVSGGLGEDRAGPGAAADAYLAVEPGKVGPSVAAIRFAGARWVQGNDRANTITGTEADETVFASYGNDTMDLRGGTDTVSYKDSPTGLRMAIGKTWAQDTYGMGAHKILNVENLVGSAYNDILSGSVGDNVLEGGLGDDLIHGGDGFDLASYAGFGAPVTVDLAIERPQNTGFAGWDTLLSIEAVVGGQEDDVLHGHDGANALYGGDGQDLLFGRGGADRLHGGADLDVFAYEAASDSPASDPDTIRDFVPTIDLLDLSDLDLGTYLGSRGFTGRDGEVRYAAGRLEADTDGDGGADVAILFARAPDLTEADLLL